jgi:hypothetical protein
MKKTKLIILCNLFCIIAVAQKNNSNKYVTPKLYDFFNKKQSDSISFFKSPKNLSSELPGYVIVLPVDNMRCYVSNMKLVEKFRSTTQKPDLTFIPNASK